MDNVYTLTNICREWLMGDKGRNVLATLAGLADGGGFTQYVHWNVCCVYVCMCVCVHALHNALYAYKQTTSGWWPNELSSHLPFYLFM